MRTFVIGDIHGACRALTQCLERSGFDWDKDLLITLGDICDGWSEVYECVQVLLQLRTINIIGNHDAWFHTFLDTGIHADTEGPWEQGGYGTVVSYLRRIGKETMIARKPWDKGYITSLNPDDIPPSHRRFFKHQSLYYVDDSRRCFVHGGFNRKKNMTENRLFPYNFYWDRDLWSQALSCSKDQKLKMEEDFTDVFIGHTTTEQWNTNDPMYAGGIWNLDTGAGWNGKLTIMDVETKEYWQSDLVTSLYPDEVAKRK